MVIINVHCKSPEEANAEINLVCEALVGNRAFIENDIVVGRYDDNQNNFAITLGEANKHYVEYTVENVE